MNSVTLQKDLFGEPSPVSPATESIKYIGSKLKLLPQILRLARLSGARSVLCGFSGSTRVSQAFARSGYDVICNDRAVWSEVLGSCYLRGGRKEIYRELIEHLNGCPPRDGWFTAHFGGNPTSGGSSPKRPWQIHNTRKLDGIREEIDRIGLNSIQKNVALTSLMLALDRVDSTLGHFSSYLREWAPRSFNTLRLQIPDIVESKGFHEVTRKDIFDVISRPCQDLVYFDPPYGSNNEKMPPSRVRYSAYYHVWTSICLNDEPEVFGKVNRRIDTRDEISASVFEEFRRGSEGRFLAIDALRQLIERTSSPYLILSYSSGGRATASELNEIMQKSGRIIEVVEVDYRKNVMAGMCWTNEWLRDAEHPNREFLFLIRKR